MNADYVTLNEDFLNEKRLMSYERLIGLSIRVHMLRNIFELIWTSNWNHKPNYAPSTYPMSIQLNVIQDFKGIWL